MKDISNQNSTPEKTDQKKQWIEPKIEIINNGYIASGNHSGGIEGNYAPGAKSSSPANFKYFSS